MGWVVRSDGTQGCGGIGLGGLRLTEELDGLDTLGFDGLGLGGPVNLGWED